jgi:hypothetical protein
VTRPVPRDILILWHEGEWRCEMHTNGTPGIGRFLLYCGEDVVTSEPVHLGAAAVARSAILRQRVLRGDIRPTE